ncbi:MAG: GAF domain-containing protein [Calothrix sp. MO_167.B42]|nr:GAF domain-containing protein [Calothrix sp. MO_167.B42]
MTTFSAENNRKFVNNTELEYVNLNRDVPQEIFSDFKATQQQTKNWQQYLLDISKAIQQAADFDTLLKVTAAQVREKIVCDRVAVYQFNPDWSGKFVAESVANGWMPLVGGDMEDTHFQETQGNPYAKGEGLVVNDIYQAGNCQGKLAILEQFGIKSYIIVPVFSEEKLWGLLAIYQHSGTRNWEDNEVNFLTQVSLEFSKAISQEKSLQQFRTLQLQAQTKKSKRNQIVQQEKLSKLSITIGNRIDKSSDVETFFRAALQTINSEMGCERATVYRFNPDWTGQFVTEAVADNLIPMVKGDVEDAHFQQSEGHPYVKGEDLVVNDIYNSDICRQKIDILEYFEVKAYVVVPIFSEGKLWGLLAVYQSSEPRNWQDYEVNFLRQIGWQFGIALSETRSLATSLKPAQIVQQEKLSKLSMKIAKLIGKSSDVKTFFQNTTQTIRLGMGCERATVYRFNPDWTGKFVTESVADNLLPMLKGDVEDTHFQNSQGYPYGKGESLVVNDIYNSGLCQGKIDILENFKIKAYVVSPIFFEAKLWGLLAVYQTSEPRNWQDYEVNFLSQAGLQFGIALSETKSPPPSLKATQIAQQEQLSKVSVQTAKLIGRSANVDAFFKTTTQAIREVMQCDRVTVYRFNPDWSGKFVAESVANGGMPMLAGDIEDTHFQASKGGRYARGENLVVNDIYNSAICQGKIDILESFQVKAYICAPIFSDDKLWGLLTVYQDTATRNWEDYEAKFLNQLGLQFGIAISKTASLQVSVDKQEKLSQLSRNLANQISKFSDVDAFLKNTTQKIRQGMGCDRVVVYRYNPDWSGEFIAESAADGWMPLRDKKFNLANMQEDAGNVFNIFQGNRGRQKTISVVDDIYKSGLSDCYIDLLEQFEAKAYMAVPIFHEEQLWGLLAVYQNSQPREWQESEANILQQLAVVLTIGMQQVQSFGQLQKAGIRDRAVAKIIERIRQTLDLDNILRISTKEVRSLLKADRVAVYRFDPDWSGEFISESVGNDWVPVVGEGIRTIWEDTYLQETKGGRYAKGESFVVNDIYQVGHARCHLDILEQFEVRAYMIVPVFVGTKLWGFLAAYQNSGTRTWQDWELGFLKQIGMQFGLAISQAEYVQQMQSKSEQLARIAEQEKALTNLVNRIRQTSDMDVLFKTSSQEIRRFLQCDRVAVYRFNPDWSGNFINESVGSDWVPLVESDIEDIHFQEMKGGRYSKGDNCIINNIYQADLCPTLLEILERFQAKAYVIVPIFSGERLWGLLSAYQNSSTRNWLESEVSLLARISDQLGLALQQHQYVKEIQLTKALEAEAKQKAAKELLQKRSIELLTALRPALKGDLTVRAPITEDELGTVADAYNNTLQSLRQIVLQVQAAAQQVAKTCSNSDVSLGKLSNRAQEQSSQVSNALGEIELMVDSTQAVVNSADSVQLAVQQANQTVESGNTAMNQTVEAIQGIRETVAQTSKKIKRLSESSQKISKVVNLISNFATQTNVLALNAAIEATRAGEYGKGFAVVADEVRSLSRQSGAATIEIEKLVQEIQAETGEVAAAMETGIQQVVEGTNLVNETRQNLNEIVTATNEITKLVEKINNSTQTQMLHSHSVTTSMNDVSDISHKTVAEVQDIGVVFQQLSEMAQELLKTVSKFKVN